MTDRCRDVEPLLSAWVDDMLDGVDRDRVEDHLRACSACCEDAQGLRQVHGLLRNLPVRRLPDELKVPPEATPAWEVPKTPASWTGGQRAAAGLAVAVGLVGGAAFALGGQPPPGERVVAVPVDLYVADHLVHAVGGPLPHPVVVDGGP